ncbi:MAG: MFS transporter [Deltaproteobacteria bacterium]|nr:MFS transporter [Deltaproteobacteria bacterium]
MKTNTRRFKSLRHFTQDGLWSSVCEGIAESNFSPFAVVLEATAAEVGFLSSMQQLLGCWLQLWCEPLIGFFGSRKRLVLWCVAAQSTMLMLMIWGAFSQWGLLVFAVLTILFTSFGAVSGPVWNTWVSDLLPPRRRGVCFAIRNQRTYPMSFLSLILGGFLLDHLGAGLSLRLAFCAVFSIGLFAKVSALRHLSLQQEHAYEKSTSGNLGPLGLLRESTRDPELRKIVFFFGAMGFAVNLSGPFQAPYLLKTLNFSYTQYTFLLGVMSIARFLAAPYVGRIVDRIGSRRLLMYSSMVMPVIPIGWCLTANYYALVGVFFISGTFWAAFDLCAFTYLAECMPVALRPRVFAAKQVSWNLLSFAGAAVGGLLIESSLLQHTLALGTVVVFWASAFARGFAALSVLRIPISMTDAAEEAEPEQAPAQAA